jgi:hypothetical protein
MKRKQQKTDADNMSSVIGLLFVVMLVAGSFFGLPAALAVFGFTILIVAAQIVRDLGRLKGLLSEIRDRLPPPSPSTPLNDP